VRVRRERSLLAAERSPARSDRRGISRKFVSDRGRPRGPGFARACANKFRRSAAVGRGVIRARLVGRPRARGNFALVKRPRRICGFARISRITYGADRVTGAVAELTKLFSVPPITLVKRARSRRARSRAATLNQLEQLRSARIPCRFSFFLLSISKFLLAQDQQPMSDAERESCRETGRINMGLAEE